MSHVAIPDDGGDTMISTDYGDIKAPSFAPVEIGKQIFDKIPDLRIKDDDIMLCTYMKTGESKLREQISQVQLFSVIGFKSHCING